MPKSELHSPVLYKDYIKRKEKLADQISNKKKYGYICQSCNLFWQQKSKKRREREKYRKNLISKNDKKNEEKKEKERYFFLCIQELYFFCTKKKDNNKWLKEIGKNFNFSSDKNYYFLQESCIEGKYINIRW